MTINLKPDADVDQEAELAARPAQGHARTSPTIP